MWVVTFGEFETGKLRGKEESMSTLMEQAQSIINSLTRRHANGLSQRTRSQPACSDISGSRKCKTLVGRIEVGFGLVPEPEKGAEPGSAPESAIKAGSRFARYYLEKIANLDKDVETAYAKSGVLQTVSAVSATYAAVDPITRKGFRSKNEFDPGL